MTTNPHADRFDEIGFWTVPMEGTAARKKLETWAATHEKNPKFHKAIDETWKAATALLQVQSVNGAGLRADSQLREFNLEYNSRVFKGSLRDMPSSFNVVEAFNKFLPRTATFEIRDEKDHLFSFQHFIDWVTSGETETGTETETVELKLTEHLIEGQIYSYTSFDRVSELCFSVEDSTEFGIGSISMVRFGHEVSLLILAGKKADLALETEKAKEAWHGARLAPHRSHIEVAEPSEVRAEPLSDTDDLWKTVVLMRLDENQRTVDVRYVMADMGASYNIHTDDVSTFLKENGDELMKGAKETYVKSRAALEKYQTLFELGKTFLSLPVFFSAHEDEITIQRHPTEFKEFRSKLANKKVVDKVHPKHWLQFRNVYTLKKPTARSPDKTSFTAPDFKVETRGYWKKLPIENQGVDKYGQSIYGRTWVTQTLTWVEERPAGLTTIKSSSAHDFDGLRAGYIYVMRSAAHEKNLFKIGLTTRTTDIRSKELSRSTSSPDHFLTVQEWATPDCSLAEKLIHERLAAHRINPSREFFKADYKDIAAVIQDVITSVEKMAANEAS